MENCRSMDTPLATNWRKEYASSKEEVNATICRKLVISLMYPMNTRLDMCYAVNQLRKAMVRPTKLYWKASKHVLRYLRGTTKYGLWFRQAEGVRLQGFTNSYWVRSPSNKKSTSGVIFNIGSTTLSWYNRKQRSVSLSSTEVEYIVASQATCQEIWTRKVLVGLFSQEMDLTMIYCDNQSRIKLSKNLVFHDRSNHIGFWYHHLWDFVQRIIMLL